jgi:hypothetical protein
MLKYNNFLLEKEFKKWDEFILNEGFDNLFDRIDTFLSKEYEIDVDKFNDLVLTILNKFKNRTRMLVIISSILLTSYMTINKLSNLMDKADIEPSKKESVLKVAKKDKTTKIKPKNQIIKFLKKMAERESTNDPASINNLGYVGKYQFGGMALKDVDREIDVKKFRNNPDLRLKLYPEKEQDKDMIKLLKKNKSYLGNYIKNYNNKVIGGVRITLSGLLAASHLVGADSVKKYLDSNGAIIPKDGNGTPVTEYIKKFGGYNILL